MRNLTRVSVLLSVLLIASGSPPAKAEAFRSDANDRAFEWCLTHFPKNEGENAIPLPGPGGKLRPFELTDAVAPSHLVTKTEVMGELPPAIEKYRGLWIWPAVEKPSPAAIFVERITATELTIAPAVKRDKDRDETDYQVERITLIWTGAHFSYSKVKPAESRQVEILVSQSGEAMLMVSGYSRKNTLEGPEGVVEGAPFGEAWPGCFISENTIQRDQ